MKDNELYQKTLEQYNDPDYARQYAGKIEDRIDQWMFDEFLPLLPQDAHVLDVGCAAGRDTDYLAKQGFNVTGLDISEGLIKIANKKYPNRHFVVGDMLNLPFEDEVFGGVWSHAALVHLPSQEKVEKTIKELYRVLKPGGHVMIVTKGRLPEDPETAIRKDKLSGRERYFRFQTKAGLKAALEKGGFEVIKTRFYNEQQGQQHKIMRDENWIFTISRKVG